MTGTRVYLMGLCAALAVACGGERVSPGAVPDAGQGVDGGSAVEDGGASSDGGALADGGPAGDGGTALDGGAGGDGGPLADGGAVCVPNLDGRITRAEVSFPVGASVIYAVNRDGTTVDGVSTAGSDGGSAGRIWDFSAARSEDHRVLDELVSPTGQWWASSYPTATFATLADRASGVYGVYRATDTALTLLGTVSTEANKTNLALSPPVDVLRFPLAVGTTWDVTSTGSGTYNYSLLQNSNQYHFSVDARGEVWTPSARFPVLRVRMDLTQSIPLTVFSRTVRSYVFVSECWGVVARVTSADNEAAVEFTRAVEYRRLSL